MAAKTAAKTLQEAVPDATIRQALMELARQDPVAWVMFMRRLKGQPYTFDMTGAVKKAEDWTPAKLLRHRPFLMEPLRDQHPHKVWRKGRQVGVSELGISDALWFLHSHPGRKWIYCVPDDAEVLTRRGWLRHNAVEPNDEALALDPKLFVSKWEPILEVKTFAWAGSLEAVGPFHCTPEHRWPVERRKAMAKGKWYGGEREVIRTNVLTTLHRVPRAATAHLHDRGESILSPRLAAILGWVVTDGHQWVTGTKPHLDTPMMEVVQSSKKHLAKVERLLHAKRQASRNTNAPTLKTGERGGRIVGYTSAGNRIYGDVFKVRVRREDIDGILASGYRCKDDLPGIVARLSPQAAKAMWQAMLDAEGCKSGRGLRSIFFAQVPGPVLDAFQILCALTGRVANLTERGAYVTEPEGKHTWFQPRAKSKNKPRRYQGTVWCPRTPSGTWFMRYRGKVTFTGNTFPTNNQLTDFSTTRIAEAFHETPRMKRIIGVPNQVMTKRIGDSYLLLRSAWESNLGEGVDADGVTFDEKDRMKEGIEVAFKESLKSSPYGLIREISTPTLPGRGVDASYQQSDQREWLVKCSKCGLEQTVDYPDNILQLVDVPMGTTELPENAYIFACRIASCRGALDRLHGRWVARFPNRQLIRGYWIPQTICPWITATRLMQNKLTYKIKQLWENYSSLPGFPVLCEGGVKNIEDVEVGDRVWTHRGRWRPVTRLHPHPYTGEIVDVYVGSAREPTHSVTRDHPFLVEGGGWLNAEHLVAENRRTGYRGHWLCYPKPRLLERAEVLPLIGNVTEEWARFLGLFMAEGCCTGMEIVHHRKEKSLISFSEKMLGKLGKVRTVDVSKYKGQAKNAIVVNGSRAVEVRDLFRHLYHGTLSNKMMPAVAFNLPRRHKLAFLKGYVEGDGYVAKDGSLELQTCSPHIAHGLQMLIASLGYFARIRDHKNKLNGKTFLQHRLTYSGLPGRKLLAELGYAVKEEGYSYYREDEEHFLVPVRKVAKRKIRNRMVYNFAVQGDESYLLNGVVSHNCLGKTSVGENVLLTAEDFEASCAGHQPVPRRTDDWDHIAIGIDWGHLNWVVVLGINSENQRTYLLNLGVFQDDQHHELMSVKDIDAFIAPYEPDVIIADAGYGKDRNAYLLRKYPGKLWACWYNSVEEGGGNRTFNPVWSDAASRVLVDRTMSLKVLCRSIKEGEIGFPAPYPLFNMLQKHFLNLAPLRVEEDGKIVEVIDHVGDDHLAHAANYAKIGLDRLLDSRSKFSFDFGGGPL